MRATSLRAYEEIRENGKLSERRWQAFDALFHHGPCTGQELCKIVGIPGLWKRLSELKRLGFAQEVGEKICTVTGMESIAWDAITPEQAEPVSSYNHEADLFRH